MTGASIGVTVRDNELQSLIKDLEKRFGNQRPALVIIGETIRESVQKNFERGGRPIKWESLSKATLARKKSTKILVEEGLHGGLKGSIHYEAGNNSVVVGTDKKYGAVHQFGAKKFSFGTIVTHVKKHTRKDKNGKKRDVRAHSRTVKLPWGDIPARPYLVIQDEDWEEIKEELKEYIITGRA